LVDGHTHAERDFIIAGTTALKTMLGGRLVYEAEP